MKKDYKLFLKLFVSTFYISAFTFGGGYVIVPLMRKKFVEGYRWIEEREMLDITAIAQSSPGAIAVNASILIGYRVAGVAGAAVTVLGTVLPPLITLSVISMFYTAFQESAAVGAVLRGMNAGVAAVIADVILTMGADIAKEKSVFSFLVMALSFLAVFIFHTDVKLVILACGLLGLANALLAKRKNSKGGRAD